MKLKSRLGTTCSITMARHSRVVGAARLLPLLLLLMLPAVVQAQFNYTTDNGTITITGYTGPGGAVTIPSTINGLPVTSIGGYAFANCTSLTSVTIPDIVTYIEYGTFSSCSSLTSVTIPNSVTGIGYGAFSSCTSLTSVTIPNSVTYIGWDAFNYCTSLTSVTIPTSVTIIEPGTFSGCTSLTSVSIPNSITSIGGGFSQAGISGAFRFCTSLTNITLPDSLTNIENETFSYCTSLTSVTIGNSVTNIGERAFYFCTSLTNVTIGNGVTSIEASAFSDCTSLTAITVDALNSAYSSVDGILFNKNRTTLIQYPGGKAGSYTIPNSVTSIGASAFAGCTSLSSVTLPNSVTYIGDWSFSYCTNLTGVYFQGNPPSVDSSVFQGANKTTVYYLPGTTGWGATFAGRPTGQWLPETRTNEADFGVRTNQFGFNIRWASDKVVVVEASPDLSNPVWTPVSTNTLTGGSSYFSDPQWTNHPTRFYRLRSP